MQYLDQLVGKTSLDKKINKKQLKTLHGKETRELNGVQKGRSHNFLIG
jgi:hypothetical protein